jgi:hypothetical protein
MNLKMVEGVEGEFSRLAVVLMVLIGEFVFSSRLEGVLEDTGKKDESDERGSEEKEAVDEDEEDEDEEVEDNRSINSTNESRYSNWSIG